MKKFGLKADQADVILPALMIVERVVEAFLFKIKKIYCPKIGLGYGVLLDMTGEKLKNIR